MSLEQQIEQDTKEAMRSRETVRLSVLRMLKTAIMNEKISAGTENLPDSGVQEIIQKQAKQRKESIDSYLKGGREDLAEKEREELKVLEKYLPEPLSEEELTGIIQAAIKSTGAPGPEATGQVMKEVMPRVKGRADGKQVSSLVAGLLQRK